VSGVVVWRCESCGRRSFPRRELCPYCAGRAYVPEPVERGVVTEMTTHRGVDIACVRAGADVTLLARVEGAVGAGSEVSLRFEDGAPVAAAL
jgi:uncharacterized OB-fold protein